MESWEENSVVQSLEALGDLESSRRADEARAKAEAEAERARAREEKVRQEARAREREADARRREAEAKARALRDEVHAQNLARERELLEAKLDREADERAAQQARLLAHEREVAALRVAADERGHRHRAFGLVGGLGLAGILVAGAILAQPPAAARPDDVGPLRAEVVELRAEVSLLGARVRDLETARAPRDAPATHSVVEGTMRPAPGMRSAGPRRAPAAAATPGHDPLRGL